MNLGKCYESATENFIPRPRKPRVDLENQMTMIDDLEQQKSMEESDTKQKSMDKISVSDSLQRNKSILCLNIALIYFRKLG